MWDFYNWLSSLCCVLFTKKMNKSFFSNTILEAVNIKTALSFRPGRCVEINLYSKILYLTKLLYFKNKNESYWLPVSSGNKQLFFLFFFLSQPFRFAFRILLHRDFDLNLINRSALIILKIMLHLMQWSYIIYIILSDIYHMICLYRWMDTWICVGTC
jgi:hypothetical protein